jgi:glycosyltransferase involved in cell wall biosynthesis
MPVARSTNSVVFLVDKRNWAFDFIARSIARRLRPKWRCRVAYAEERPYLDPHKVDVVYVFFWGERYYEQFGFARTQIIKEVASYRWMTEERFHHLSPSEFVSHYLDGVGIVTTPCAALCQLLRPLRPEVYHCPNGIEPSLFNAKGRKRGEFTLIWAGNARDPGKGLHDIIIPGIGSDYKLIVADGRHSRLEMRRLYRSADVILIASGVDTRSDVSLESQPLPLMEAMACGCFPVATNVGIVPELVRDRFNGCVIPKRTPQDLRRAVDWCAENLDYVRAMGEWNSVYVSQYRTWDRLVPRFDEILSYAVQRNRREAGAAPPAVSGEHPGPSSDICVPRPPQSSSPSRDLATLVPLAVRDCWNSWSWAHRPSRAFEAIRRHAKSGSIRKVLSKRLRRAFRTDKQKK